MNTGGRSKMNTRLRNPSKDRDEDLMLFREMHKRDKDRVVSLLQPVSDEFEPNGNYPIYGMSSMKKGLGFGFHGETEKNDYDWLKTPPATPLFPSLEMETRNGHELIVQRELPIMQPLSRFAGKPEEKEKKRIDIRSENEGRSKITNPKPRIPARSVTPSGRPTSLFTDQKKNIKTAPIPLISTVSKINTTSSISNQSKTIQGTNFSTRTTSQKPRGVSPLVTSRISGFSDETPPNLRTDRSSSASRGRPVNQTTKTTLPAVAAAPPQKPEVLNMRARRQSCSPSVMRGRKVAPTIEETTAQKSNNRMFQTGNGGQFLGSRMVDKIMNARKSNIEEKKLNGSINEGSGYGRIMSKSSLDHTETKRDSIQSRGPSTGRKSTSIAYAPSLRSTGGNGSYKTW